VVVAILSTKGIVLLVLGRGEPVSPHRAGGVSHCSYERGGDGGAHSTSNRIDIHFDTLTLPYFYFYLYFYSQKYAI
jgi:hypothetical protein